MIRWCRTRIPWRRRQGRLCTTLFAQTGLGRYGKGPVAAVILELIQAKPAQPLSADYAKFVRELCDINHALLIIDEVQTGIGRTGKWFAFQRDDPAA